MQNQKSNFKLQNSNLKVNTLLKAFTDAGYNLDDKQANEFCKKNFNDDSLQAYAFTISTATAPAQQEKEVDTIVTGFIENYYKSVTRVV